MWSSGAEYKGTSSSLKKKPARTAARSLARAHTYMLGRKRSAETAELNSVSAAELGDPWRAVEGAVATMYLDENAYAALPLVATTPTTTTTAGDAPSLLLPITPANAAAASASSS